MDPETKRLLMGIIVGQVVWMAKDIFLAARTQTQRNTEEIGGLKDRITRVEKDVTAAHSGIRELKGRKN